MVETRRKSNAPTRGVSPVAGKSLPSRSRSKTPIKSAVAFTTEKVSIADLKTDEKSSKKHVEYEFGGPVGAFFVVVGLPLVIYALYFFCNKDICLQSPLNFPWKRFIETLPKQASELFSWEALHIYGFWICFQLLLERFLPGEVVEGATLPNGSRLKYTMSGHLQFWISLVLMGHAVPRLIKDPQSGVWSLAGLSPLPLHLLYDHYVPLITVSCLGALALSVYLYATSFFPGRILASGGNTGSPVYDFFIGRELNPRVGSLDLKEFCELRPGLIGWAVLNLGMLY